MERAYQADEREETDAEERTIDNEAGALLIASHRNDLRNLTQLVAGFLGATPVRRRKKKKSKAAPRG